MKTYFLTGDMNYAEYGGKWITKKLNNEDWNYWIVLELINMAEHMDDYEYKYIVQVSAVSPEAAGQDNIKAAIECCGLQELIDNANTQQLKDKLIVEALSYYGISAPLDSFSGNDYRKVLSKARKALPAIVGMFGFFMDGSKNALGHNGWDFIAGNLSFDNLPTEPTPNLHVES